MRHTPGPWKVVSDPNCDAIGDRHAFGVQQEPNKWIVADVNGDLEDAAQIKANAYLIAAAPELLDALKEMRARLQRVDDLDVALGENVGAFEAIARADAAIAKAESGQ